MTFLLPFAQAQHRVVTVKPRARRHSLGSSASAAAGNRAEGPRATTAGTAASHDVPALDFRRLGASAPTLASTGHSTPSTSKQVTLPAAAGASPITGRSSSDDHLHYESTAPDAAAYTPAADSSATNESALHGVRYQPTYAEQSTPFAGAAATPRDPNMRRVHESLRIDEFFQQVRQVGYPTALHLLTPPHFHLLTPGTQQDCQ